MRCYTVKKVDGGVRERKSFTYTVAHLSFFYVEIRRRHFHKRAGLELVFYEFPYDAAYPESRLGEFNEKVHAADFHEGCL